MKKLLSISVSLFLITTVVTAQCKSGNCINGKGKFDYGWCVYEGDFKNEKPEGKGKMTYSDYTYEGNFSDGVEHGQGIITYKDGKKEAVLYSKGQKLDVAVNKVKAEDYKPLQGSDAGCISGDCNNGIGTYKFESGNTYTGNFVNKARQGKGSFYFANGDKFEGVFANNQPSQGTFTYTTGGKYTGTYDAAGNELNGIVTAPNGQSASFVNGRVVYAQAAAASNTSKDAFLKKAAPEKVKGMCRECHGTGKTHTTIYGGQTNIDKNGHRSTVFGEYSSCTACFGKGVAL